MKVGKKESKPARKKAPAPVTGLTDPLCPAAVGSEIPGDDLQAASPFEVWPTPGLSLEQTQVLHHS